MIIYATKKAAMSCFNLFIMVPRTGLVYYASWGDFESILIAAGGYFNDKYGKRIYH